jgi:hypothetical protein
LTIGHSQRSTVYWTHQCGPPLMWSLPADDVGPILSPSSLAQDYRKCNGQLQPVIDLRRT